MNYKTASIEEIATHAYHNTSACITSRIIYYESIGMVDVASKIRHARKLKDKLVLLAKLATYE